MLRPFIYVSGRRHVAARIIAAAPVGGRLFLLGLFTRPVAFILSGMMAIAYFMAHAPKSFFPVVNGGEPAMLYAFIFLFFAAAGAGSWSLDALRSRPAAQ